MLGETASFFQGSEWFTLKGAQGKILMDLEKKKMLAE
jgi:hypothetical protein